ncbi:hypothetical protein ENBRE01_1362 [Enteropsectra breve]|nr:hypothetical protein ENBRE01_1362 [Enteropsectra breve]
MQKKTYIIGKKNKNCPNIYRKYGCEDHLFPYQCTSMQPQNPALKLACALSTFNSQASYMLKIEDNYGAMPVIEEKNYLSIIDAEKLVYKKVNSGCDTQELVVELHAEETQLYLCRNYITDLNENIAELSNLAVFQTCCNYICYLPFGIGRLKNLKMLILSRNRLQVLPDEIGLCRELREIDIGYNSIKKLPRSLIGLQKMHTLHINNNELAELPAFIGKLVSLKYLNISSNKISYIPFEIFKLPFLMSLVATNCNFGQKQAFCACGDLSLKEIVCRHIIRNNLSVKVMHSKPEIEYLMRAEECAFCGGPFFEYFVDVCDFHEFDSEVFPVRYKMCGAHYKKHSERLESLFEIKIRSSATGLEAAQMPSVTGIFEPYSFNEQQCRKMQEALEKKEPMLPLICIAKYNELFVQQCSLNKLLLSTPIDYNKADQ